MTVRREASRSTSWHAWVGDISRVVRIAEQMEHLVEPRVRQQQEEELAEFMDERVAGESADADERRKEAIIARVSDRWAIDATAARREFATKESGPYRDVLSGIDPETIQDLTIGTREPGWRLGNEIELRLSRSDGCHLAVKGDDPEWVRATYTSLVDDIRRGVPRWHGFRTEAFAIAALAIIALPPIAVVAVRNHDFGAFIVASAACLLVALLWLPLFYVLARILPGFELTTFGRKGAGARIMAITGAFALGVMSSTVAALIQ